MRDVSSGKDTPIAQSQPAPFWSPAGDWLACAVGRSGARNMWVSHPDGTASRVVATGISDATTWSPDGVWIAVATARVGISIVRASDGLLIPLPHTGSYGQVIWRP